MAVGEACGFCGRSSVALAAGRDGFICLDCVTAAFERGSGFRQCVAGEAGTCLMCGTRGQPQLVDKALDLSAKLLSRPTLAFALISDGETAICTTCALLVRAALESTPNADSNG